MDSLKGEQPMSMCFHREFLLQGRLPWGWDAFQEAWRKEMRCWRVVCSLLRRNFFLKYKKLIFWGTGRGEVDTPLLLHGVKGWSCLRYGWRRTGYVEGWRRRVDVQLGLGLHYCCQGDEEKCALQNQWQSQTVFKKTLTLCFWQS